MSATTAPVPRLRVRPRAVDVVVAAGAAVLVLSLTAGAALQVANSASPLAPGVLDWWLMPIVGGLAFGGAGFWLVHARPRLLVGWLLAGTGLVITTAGTALEYAVHEFTAFPAASGLPVLAFWYANWAWATCLLTVATVVPLVLPEGRLPSPRWRPAMALAVAAVGITTVQWMLTPYASFSPALARAGIENPIGVEAANAPLAGAVDAVVSLGAVGVALVSILVRWRRADPVGRQQLKWIGLGAVAGLVLFALGFVVGPWATALALVPLPAACVLAALRHGLWDVDVVLSRSLVYAMLTTLVVAAYATVVGLAGGLLGRTTGAPVVATGVVAVLVLPLHRRVQELVNRLVHGERDEPFAVLSRLGDRLGAAQDDETVSEQVLPAVVATVARSLRVPFVAVQLADGTAVRHGVAQGPVEEIPLSYGGTEVGRLRVAARPGGLGRADRTALDALARQAAVAVHTVVLARDVRRSREAAVSAREEERRRLYRDLHDGLGPSLAALALQVETARDLAATDPARATGLLDRALVRLKGTVGEVRTVVHGLRPPALDDLGLAEALRELGGRFTGERLRVVVDVDGEGEAASDLPAAVEVAAYTIAAEALTNVARHAGATTAHVRVARSDGALTIRVRDDGGGIAGDSRPGVGIASMRRRAEELGGRLSLESGAGGTVLEARLPVGEA